MYGQPKGGVHGTISDEEGDPLSFATILVKQMDAVNF
jgi:hypothetical protein